jgi:CRISPR type III-associated protein (TIGR04423 family)
MIITRDELKSFYESLGEFEGYIQMSDEKLDKNKIFTKKQALPKYEKIHNEKNFIFEAMFFDGDRSISIRQFNDKFLVVDKNLSSFSNKTSQQFLTQNDNIKIEITTIWEEENFYEELKTLKPIHQLFSGFKGDKK